MDKCKKYGYKFSWKERVAFLFSKIKCLQCSTLYKLTIISIILFFIVALIITNSLNYFLPNISTLKFIVCSIICFGLIAPLI